MYGTANEQLKAVVRKGVASWLNNGMNTTTDFSLARVIPVLGESIDAGTKEAAK